MGTSKKATVILVTIFGFVNFSLQLKFKENITSNYFEVTDYKFFTESNYANLIEQQTELSLVSFIIATCTQAGIFPDPANESNFYVCLSDETSGFLKYDFSCPPQEYFDSTNLQCISSAVTASTSVSPTTAVSFTTLANLQCLFPGIFPLPGNCKMYYRCTTSLKMFNFTCPGPSYFNELILKCSLIITPTCQEQILKNSTTTISTTLTTATETSTTISLSSTKTSETSKTTVPSTLSTPQFSKKITESFFSTTMTTPFICKTSGTFGDPTNCKSYFRCSTKNVAFKYICPGQSYFNEFTKKCSFTATPRC